MMNIETDIFKCHIPDFEKIINYGFSKNKDKYIYKKLFMNNQFQAVIEVSKLGEVFGTVYELENNDEYLPLRVKSQKGAFVEQIRTGYRKILEDVREYCFNKNYFIYPQANRIANFIQSEYGDIPEFLWEKFPNFGVFKNRINGKWYGIIMNIDYSKLDKYKSGEIEILNVKLDSDIIQQLLKKMNYYPAWHMNKKSWITIVLDETLPDKNIIMYLKQSYTNTN